MCLVQYLLFALLAVSNQSQMTQGSVTGDGPKLDDENELLQRLLNADFSRKETESTLLQLQDKDTSLETDVKEKHLDNKQQRDYISGGLGQTYVRWGRNNCPGKDNNLVYKGFAGGSFWTHSGGAADFLCLPEDPTWGSYVGGTSKSGFIYGAEYRTFTGSNPFPTVPDESQVDVPCCLCSTTRTNILMIPGRTNCYPGWVMEYTGYLMSGAYDHVGPTNYVCVDTKAESRHGSSANQEGHLMYVVQAKCGSLPCPPYAENRVIACVLCSK